MNSAILSVVSSGLEILLNQRLYQDDGLKPLRKNLIGKTLVVHLREFPQPLILLFGEQQLNLVTVWHAQADCHVTTHLRALIRLRDQAYFTDMIRQGELSVTGDLQLLNQFAALIAAADQDLVDIFAPYTGDIIAQGMHTLWRRAVHFAQHNLAVQPRYLAETLTEEWRLLPGRLETTWFCTEVDHVKDEIEFLSSRITALEHKCHSVR